MIDIAVACFKCWRSRWAATGRLLPNRRGLLRAELRCEDCGYVFFSARPAALAAAKLVAPPEISTAMSTAVQKSERQPVSISDFKKRAAGDADV